MMRRFFRPQLDDDRHPGDRPVAVGREDFRLLDDFGKAEAYQALQLDPGLLLLCQEGSVVVDAASKAS